MALPQRAQASGQAHPSDSSSRSWRACGLAEAGRPHFFGVRASVQGIFAAAYLAPDDQHLGVSERSTVLLSSGPPVGSFRPSQTFLFESAARVFGPAALGVILTGMRSDGVQGLRAIKAAGGRVIAQDELTSPIYGMPEPPASSTWSCR